MMTKLYLKVISAKEKLKKAVKDNSGQGALETAIICDVKAGTLEDDHVDLSSETFELAPEESADRKSTRLNSSHSV